MADNDNERNRGPNAAKAPEGALDRSIAAKQAQAKDTSEYLTAYARHNWWCCCRRSSSSLPCPRCCRHVERDCACPAFAEQVAFELLGAT